MVTTQLEVRPEWIDLNGHMHDACYVDAFCTGVTQMFEALELGSDYRTTGAGFFNLGMNLDYRSELFGGDPLRVTVNLLDFNHKLLHLYLELYHEGTGVLSATNERLLIHMDMATRKSTPFPADAIQRLQGMHSACSATPRPANLGRSLAIRR